MAISRRDLEDARRRVAPLVHRTPLLSFRTLGEPLGVRAYLKCENLQKTGSFKVRGAINAIARLSREELDRGVSTISAGNHAQAVAWAARRRGARAVVVMPEAATPSKVEAAKSYGAEVVLHGNAEEAFREAERLSVEQGLYFLHPFDDEALIAGHATIGLEIAEQLEALGPSAEASSSQRIPCAFVAPVGGGGQVAGVALAARLMDPPGVVYGVEPEGAPSMRRSLREGRPARLSEVATIADGLAPPMAGRLAYPIVRRCVEGVALVSDAELLEAMRLLLVRAKLVSEPSGAAAVAAVLSGRLPLLPDQQVVAIVSGGNAKRAIIAEALAGPHPP